MNEEFKNINARYNDDTYPEFPYISPERITILRKGLYRKHSAKYRGVTAVFDETTGEFTFPLYGMYRVPEDIIIVPAELKLNESKTSLLTAALKAGYKQVTGPPTFQPIFFSTDSPEAKLALANKASYYRSKRKDITI